MKACSIENVGHMRQAALYATPQNYSRVFAL